MVHAVLALQLSLTGCGGGGTRAVDALSDVGPDAGAGASEVDAGGLQARQAPPLTVTGVSPPSGPFDGGNTVVVRGSALTEDARVFFGDAAVEPGTQVLLDDNSLQVVVPGGAPGSVPVRVVDGGKEAVRADAYAYNALALSPQRGSAAGGTLVELRTADAVLAEGDSLRIGDGLCTEPELLSASVLRCRTPPGQVGLSDVTLVRADGEPVVGRGAFEYVDPGDTFNGGVSGGPFEGTLDLTLADSDLGILLPQTEVLLVDAAGQRAQGMTDAQGRVTFSDPGLRAPVSVHTFRSCFESQSLLDFDAAALTLYSRISGEAGCEPVYCELLGVPPQCCDPATADPDECGAPPGGGTGGGRGVLGAIVSGELVFPGPEEFGVNAWDNIPRPLEGEIRVAYVYTTRSTVSSSQVPPGQPGLVARVEELTSPFGTRGYPYSIFARPAGLAVYALAGIESVVSGRFVPYVMGVTGDVLTSPDEETTEVDLRMEIPLDQTLQVSLQQLPAPTPRGPSEFRMQAHLDLGGEGVMLREVDGALFDSVVRTNADGLFEFYAQPAALGALQGRPYIVSAGWFGGDRSQPPYTRMQVPGVFRTAAPTELSGLLALPEQLRPIRAGRIAEDGELAWAAEGSEPDMWHAYIEGDGGTGLWRIVMGGDRRSLVLPRTDLLSAGLLTWRMRGVRVEAFDYARFNYDYLSSRLWTHESYDELQLQR